MSQTPIILALDISKACTGVCHGRVGETPQFLSLKHKAGASDSAALAALGFFVIDHLRTHSPSFVFCEAPIISGVYIKPILPKMAAFVEGICAMKRVPWRPVAASTARKRVLGNGKPAEPKKHARAMCEALGWKPSNDDEADAGIVWAHACLQVKPHSAMVITPMMQAKVADHVKNRRIGEDAGIF